MCNVNPPRPVTSTPQVENLGHGWVNEVYKVQTLLLSQIYLMHAKFEKAGRLDRNCTL